MAYTAALRDMKKVKLRIGFEKKFDHDILPQLA